MFLSGHTRPNSSLPTHFHWRSLARRCCGNRWEFQANWILTTSALYSVCREDTRGSLWLLHRTVIPQFLTRFLIFSTQTWPEVRWSWQALRPWSMIIGLVPATAGYSGYTIIQTGPLSVIPRGLAWLGSWCCWGQLSYAIKTQPKAPKATTKCPLLGAFLALDCFLMA